VTRIDNFAILAAIVAAMVRASMAATGQPIITSVSQAGTIFVAQIENASPPVCGNSAPLVCGIPARVRIERILKDPNHLLEMAALDTSLKQIISVGSDRPMAPWTDHDIGPGQRYLVFSGREGNPQQLIESPRSIELLTYKADSVGDVELVLKLAPLSLAEQISGAAAAVNAAPTSHGGIFAEYAGALFMQGSDLDVATLAQALINAPEHALSDQGRGGVLNRLYTAAHGDPNGDPDRVLQLFASLTAKYFLVGEPGGCRDAGHGELTLYSLAMRQGCNAPLPGTFNAGYGPAADSSGFTRTQRGILESYLPWFRANERASAALHSALQGDLAQRVRQKATEIANDQSRWTIHGTAALQLVAFIDQR